MAPTLSSDTLQSWITRLSSTDSFTAKTAVVQLGSGIVLLLASIAMMIISWRRKNVEKKKAIKNKNKILYAPEFPPVEPLKDFNWEVTKPEQFRPFKPTYHLTMG